MLSNKLLPARNEFGYFEHMIISEVTYLVLILNKTSL